MKIALIGTGKTGNEVVNLISSQDLVGPFNTSNPVTVEKLNSADVAILFVNGQVFLDLIPILKEWGGACVIGATGFDWPANLESELSSKNIHWLHATNFSRGVQGLHPLLDVLSSLTRLYPEFNLSIEDIHHTKKLDAPSGTALTLKTWLAPKSFSENAQDQPDIPIESIREGDVVGTHTISLDTPFETIEITHRAKDRKLFAQGAVWAAEKFLNQIPQVSGGLYSLEWLVNQERSL